MTSPEDPANPSLWDQRHMCDECGAQVMRLTSAAMLDSGLEDWVFTCEACGWEARRPEGFWGTDGRWNRRSGSLKR